MTTTAIIMMVLFLLIVWGGLVLSIANFVKHPDLTDEEVDPAAAGVWNENDCEQAAPWMEARRALVLRTLEGLKRRGVPPAAVREFIKRIGVAKANSVVDVGMLEFCIREELNRTALRRMAVLRPLKVVIENYPEGQTEELEAVNHPDDPAAGSRKIKFGRELYIEQDDFMENPPKKFFRLSLPQADAGRLIAHQPAADDDVGRVEPGRRVQGLADVRLIAVAAFQHLGLPSLVHQSHVGALAREQRLAHIGRAQRLVLRIALEIGFEQIGMAGVALPQQRQHALVAEQRLPRRLEQAQAGAGQRAAEVVLEQVFQRVELEQRADDDVVGIGEAAVVRQPDILDCDRRAMQAGLGGDAIRAAHHRCVIGAADHQHRPQQGERGIEAVQARQRDRRQEHARPWMAVGP